MNKIATYESFDRIHFAKVLRQIAREEPFCITKDKEIADMIGVSKATFSKWMSETETALPKITDLLKISKVFGCSVDTLLNISPSKVKASKSRRDMILSVLQTAKAYDGVIIAKTEPDQNDANKPKCEITLLFQSSDSVTCGFFKDIATIQETDLNDEMKDMITKSLLLDPKYDEPYKKTGSLPFE